jgi:hypothetical protein
MKRPKPSLEGSTWTFSSTSSCRSESGRQANLLEETASLADREALGTFYDGPAKSVCKRLPQLRWPGLNLVRNSNAITSEEMFSRIGVLMTVDARAIRERSAKKNRGPVTSRPLTAYAAP